MPMVSDFKSSETFLTPLRTAQSSAQNLADKCEYLANRLLGNNNPQVPAGAGLNGSVNEPTVKSPVFVEIEATGNDIGRDVARAYAAMERIENALD